MAINNVSAYQTSDGELFIDERAAKHYEKKLIVENFIERLIEENGHYHMDKDDVKDIFYKNLDELVQLLDG